MALLCNWRLLSWLVLVAAVLVGVDFFYAEFDPEEFAPQEPALAKEQEKTKCIGAQCDKADNVGWVSPKEQTPDVVLAPSSLVNYEWPPPYNASQEELTAFDRHGFAFLRQAVDPKVVNILLKEAQDFCQAQFQQRGVCQIEQIRWQTNSFRDFLLHGPLGAIVHRFMRGNGVRVQTEALFGVQHNERDPQFFSYIFHPDTPAHSGGVFHGFPTGTPAVAVWFPLHDIDSEVQGGSIRVIDGYPSTDCKYEACGGFIWPTKNTAPKTYNCTRECDNVNAWRRCTPGHGCKGHATAEKTFSFKQGDVVVWHVDMPHSTQPVLAKQFTRLAFTVRFVDSDAVLCNVAASCGQWSACCRDLFRESGRKVHSHCFPQIYPSTLKHEVEAHYGTATSPPKHLIADESLVRILNNVPKSFECL